MFIYPPTTLSPTIPKSSSSGSEEIVLQSCRNFCCSRIRGDEEDISVSVFKVRVSEWGEGYFLNLRLKKNSNKALCSKIPANSQLFTLWFLFKFVLLLWFIPTSQDNEFRFYFCSLPGLIQQGKCLKIKGKEDVDLDNLFRGYKKKNTSRNTDYTLYCEKCLTWLVGFIT